MAAVSERDTADFEAVRPRLFGIAYRMLGSVAEADDVVQDAWLRWQGTDRSVVRDAGAFLATTTTRLAINARSPRGRGGRRTSGRGCPSRSTPRPTRCSAPCAARRWRSAC